MTEKASVKEQSKRRAGRGRDEDAELVIVLEEQEREAREQEREGRQQKLRRELVDRMVGTSDRAWLNLQIDQARLHRASMRQPERADADPDISLRGRADVKGAAVSLEAKPTKDGPTVGSFGLSGSFIEVRADGPFDWATLRFKVNKADLERLDATTILVARWDPRAERFRLIPQSGFNERHGYAYARISRPGLYGTIGLPRDPRVLTTIKLLDVMSGWGVLEDVPFVDKICQVILCSSEMQELTDRFVKTGKGLQQLGFGPSDFHGWDGGTICDRCLGLGRFDSILDIDVVRVLDDPPHVIKPTFPGAWPRGCIGWSGIGPDNVPGRISALAIHPSAGGTVYAGAAAGGVFKTTNAGRSWAAQWSQQLSLAIGGLALSPSSPNVIYAATGEWENNVGAANNHFPGVGVYRSSDGGADWDLLAPIPSQNTAAVAIDPANPDRVFVAGDRGLHRTTNGGLTWDITPGKVNGVWDGVISDVVIDPNNPNTIYMGVHQGGVYLSTNGGTNWTPLTQAVNKIPTGAAANAPKIALGRAGAHGSQFVVVKMGNQVFTSINGGTLAMTFIQQTNCGGPWSFFPWANVIAVDPQNENVLLGGHDSLYRSTNGGGSWTLVGGYGTAVHPDIQSVVFDPSDHNHVYVATDGGVYESTNNGQTWTARSTGLATTQCWTVGVSEAGGLAYGVTTQDNACYEWSGGNSFSQILGPEGGWIEYDHQDRNKIYADTWFAQMNRSLDGGTSWATTGINTDAGIKEAISVAWGNSNLILAALGGSVRRTTNATTGTPPTWTTPLAPPGVAEMSAVQFAPSNDSHAYAASSSGRVWHSSDGGQNWTELVTVGLLPAARIHDIEVDWTDPLRIYLAFGALGVRQLWRGDVDATNKVRWTDVSGRLPAVSLPDLALTGLALHPTLDETIFVSNILGVYRSVDGGESWHPFDDGLPNAFVSDLDIRRQDASLYVSTMGRGLFRRFV